MIRIPLLAVLPALSAAATAAAFEPVLAPVLGLAVLAVVATIANALTGRGPLATLADHLLTRAAFRALTPGHPAWSPVLVSVRAEARTWSDERRARIRVLARDVARRRARQRRNRGAAALRCAGAWIASNAPRIFAGLPVVAIVVELIMGDANRAYALILLPNWLALITVLRTQLLEPVHESIGLLPDAATDLLAIRGRADASARERLDAEIAGEILALSGPAMLDQLLFANGMSPSPSP